MGDSMKNAAGGDGWHCYCAAHQNHASSSKFATQKTPARRVPILKLFRLNVENSHVCTLFKSTPQPALQEKDNDVRTTYGLRMVQALGAVSAIEGRRANTHQSSSGS
jgi:hypothetical protein